LKVTIELDFILFFDSQKINFILNFSLKIVHRLYKNFLDPSTYNYGSLKKGYSYGGKEYLLTTIL